jgi:hypothetical protein
MRPISFALCVVVASLIVMGCGGDSDTPATDANTTQDAGQNDVAQVDTGTADTGTEDAGKGAQAATATQAMRAEC